MNNFNTKIVALMFIATLVATTSCLDDKKKKKEPVAEETTVITKVLTLDEQIDKIMEIWPGTYNNDKQVADIEAKGGDIWRVDNSGENGYLQLQSHYIQLNKPGIAENVLYVEEYRDHQPDSTYRQRIYTISADDSLGVVRVKMWPFKDKKKYIGAWRDISVLDSLSAEEIIPFPNICDLIVKKVDDTYEMKMNGKDCAFGNKVFNYDVILSKDMFTYRDKITSKEDGKLLESAANFAYHNLDRIK